MPKTFRNILLRMNNREGGESMETERLKAPNLRILEEGKLL